MKKSAAIKAEATTMRSVRIRAAALLIALLGLPALFSDRLERTLAHRLFAA